MPIDLVCTCGRRLKARDEHAGKRIKCPACKTALTVPLAQEGGFELVPQSAPAPAPPRRGRKDQDDGDEDDAIRPRKKKKKSKPWNYGSLKTLFTVGFLPVGLLVVVGGGFGLFYSFFLFAGHEVVGDWQIESSTNPAVTGMVEISRSGVTELRLPGAKPGSARWSVKKAEGDRIELTIIDRGRVESIHCHMKNKDSMTMNVANLVTLQLRRR